MENILISIAVLLLSLTAGTFLLYKTKKEELGVFFKVVSWFVIVFSILLIFCSLIHCIVARELRMENRFKQNEMMRGEMPYMMRENGNFRFREMHDERDGRDGFKDDREGFRDGKEGCRDGKDGFKDGRDACCKDGNKKDSLKRR